MHSTSSNTHLVLYHGRCPDGLAAAWAVREVLGDQAQYVPMEYDGLVPDVQGKHLIIVDFSFKPMTMRIFEDSALSVTLLDHHASAKDMLASYQCACPQTHIEFDMHRSGAMMAWNYYHPNKAPPPLIAHIQDRDIWTWTDPNTKPFLRQLDTMALTFETFDTVAAFDSKTYDRFVESGKGLVEQYDHLCKGFLDMALPVTIDGIEGLSVSTSAHFTSDVGNLLAKKSGTFGCMWYLESPSVVKVGLRAIEGTNVSDIAVRFGGGGHKLAAAFRMPAERLPELVAGKINSAMFNVFGNNNEIL